MNARHLVLASALALAAAACGPPTLVPVSEGPGGDQSSAVAQAGAVTLVASRNRWFEAQLAEVSTPVHVIVSNESKSTISVAPSEFTLTDEHGQVYPALPAKEVIRRIFGTAASMQPPPPAPPQEPPPEQFNDENGPEQGGEPQQQTQPPSAPPQNAPPPPPSQPPAPPADQGTNTNTLAPVPDVGVRLISDVGPGVGIIDVVGHGGAPAGGGAHGAPAFHGTPPPPIYHRPYRGGYGGDGRGGYGRWGGMGPGWGRRGGYGYGYWGAPYWWAGAWGWWFAPYYVAGLDAPYYYDPDQVQALEEFGPWQVHDVALRKTELQPNQRMGGLLFFDPAWHARLVTLKFDDHAGGPPLAVRFEVH